MHSQASLLESKGHTTCPLTALELIDCKMDLWSLGRLGQALQFSSLHSLVLDYCKYGSDCCQLGEAKAEGGQCPISVRLTKSSLKGDTVKPP